MAEIMPKTKGLQSLTDGPLRNSGTALKRDNLEFVMDKKGKTGGTGGFGIFETALWDCKIY